MFKNPVRKKVLPLLLSAALLLGSAPLSASAHTRKAAVKTVKIDLSSVNSGGDGYTYDDGTVTIKDNQFSYEITGSTEASKIAVKAGTEEGPVNITLDGAKIDVSSSEDTCAFELKGSSAVNLTLKGKSTLKSGTDCAGLQVPYGTELTVTKGCTGSLNATGGNNGAGIGGGNNGSGGTVTISGGTVTATGGNSGAGIGGGFGDSGGNITISGGTVTATSNNFGAGIGGGNDGSGGNVTISGGTVTATGGNSGAGIGGGNNGSGDNVTISGGTVTATGGSCTVGIGAGKDDSLNGSCTITGGSVNAISGDGKSPGIPSGVTDGDGNSEYLTKVTVGKDAVKSESMAYTVDSGNKISTSSDEKGLLYSWLTKGEHVLAVSAAGKPYSALFSVSDTGKNSITVTLDSERKADIDLSSVSSGGDGYTYAGGTVTIKLPGNYTFKGSTKAGKIAVSAGTKASPVNITLDGADIDVSALNDACAFELKGSSAVNLTLKGKNTLKSGSSCAGLQVPDGTELTCAKGSTGSLDVTGGDSSAGIGGGSLGNGGTITISGGTVTANGGSAGIGGGGGCSGGTTTINGGSGNAEYLDTVTIKDAGGSLFSSRILEYIAVENGLGVNLYKDGRTMTSKSIAEGSGITVSTDTAGKLYLWLPAGNTKLSFTSGKTSADVSGLVGTDNKTAMTAWLHGKQSGSGGNSSKPPKASLPSVLTDMTNDATADISGAVFPSGVTGVSLSAVQETVGGRQVTKDASGKPDTQGAAVYNFAVSDSSLNIIGTPILYSLELTDQNGGAVTGFTGEVTIKIPLPAGIRGTPRVLRYEESTKTFTDMNAKAENGYLVFGTDHFSYYVIAGTGDSIALDTLNYTMPANGKYQIGLKITGNKASYVKSYSANDKAAAVVKLKNGNYEVTGKNQGTAYIMFDVYDDKNKLLTHASVRVDVKGGVKPNGNSHRQYGVY